MLIFWWRLWFLIKIEFGLLIVNGFFSKLEVCLFILYKIINLLVKFYGWSFGVIYVFKLFVVIEMILSVVLLYVFVFLELLIIFLKIFFKIGLVN